MKSVKMSHQKELSGSPLQLRQGWCVGVWDTLWEKDTPPFQGKNILGIDETYCGTFRGGIKGGEREGFSGLGSNKCGKEMHKGIKGSLHR